MNLRFRVQPTAAHLVFAQALIAIVAARLALRSVPVRSLRRTMRRAFTSDKTLPSGRRLSLNRVIRCVALAERFSPIATTCLVNALVAEALANRHGHDVKFRVGVRRNELGEFCAHAWLEYEGTVVVGGPAESTEQYTPLPEAGRLFA